MDIMVEHFPDKSVIIINKNKLIGIEGEEFQKLVQESIDKDCKGISVDMAKVEYVASWGIGTLIHAYTTCTNKNIKFDIKNVGSTVMNILHQLKLDKLFTIS